MLSASKLLESISFREISSWALTAIMIGVSTIYVGELYALLTTSDYEFSPGHGLILVSVFVVVITIMIFVPLAIIFRDRANDPGDERDKQIRNFAGYLSGIVLSLGVMIALAIYPFVQNGDVLFHLILLAFLFANATNYFVTAVHYRKISAPLFGAGDK